MDPKIGVFVCSGCGIGDALDTDDLCEVADEAGAHVTKVHSCLCNEEGIALIEGQIAREELNRVSVAACSGRVMTQLFDFGPTVLVDRASLREQVVWCQPPGEDDTQMLAQDYVRMSVVRLANSEAPEAEILDISKTIMIVGGGVAGMTSAKAAADAGYDVVLVEKEDALGGWSHKFSRRFPTAAPWTDLEDGGAADLIAAVLQHAHQDTPIMLFHDQFSIWHTFLLSIRFPISDLTIPYFVLEVTELVSLIVRELPRCSGERGPELGHLFRCLEKSNLRPVTA